MQLSAKEALLTPPLWSLAVRKVAHRVARMMFAWLMLGALVGVANWWRIGGGGLGMAAQVIAGMITLPLLGGLLGLFFDRARESLIGGGFGTVVGLVGVAISPANPPSEAVGVCVLIGALIGATCWPWMGVLTKTLGFTRRCWKASVDAFLRQTSAYSRRKNHAKLRPGATPPVS